MRDKYTFKILLSEVGVKDVIPMKAKQSEEETSDP